MVVHTRGPLHVRTGLASRDGAWIFSGEWRLRLSRGKQGVEALLTRYLDGPPIEPDVVHHAAQRVFGPDVTFGARGQVQYFYSGSEEPRVIEIRDPARIRQVIERGSSKIKLDIEGDLFSPAQRDLFAPEGAEPHNAPSQLLMQALAECGITASTARCIAQTDPSAHDPVTYLRHVQAITQALSGAGRRR